MQKHKAITITRELNNLIKKSDYHNNFLCVKSGKENFNRLNKITYTSLLECNSNDSSICKKSINFGD